LKETAPPAAECSLTLFLLDTETGQISSPWTLTNGVRSSRIERVLPKSGPVAQLGARFHGMEEVIGSIPIRSTNNPFKMNHLQTQTSSF
jgi:hypothetical protein